MPAIDAKIEALQEKLKQAKALKAKQEALQRAKASKEERAKDTRRKILLGSMIMASWEKNPDSKAQAMQRLNFFLTRDDDRALFDLPPVTKKTE